jgi:trimeric autotransporter adhesin
VGILSYQQEDLPVGHRIRVSAGLNFNRQAGCSRARAAGIQNVFIVASLLVALSAFGLVAQAQTISTFAGGGPVGAGSTAAPIGSPWGVARDSAGNTYVSDNLTNRIFKIDLSGNLSVVAGNEVKGYSGDGGAATLATLNGPEGLAIDANGVIYIADTGNNVIRAFNTSTTTSFDAGGVLVGPGNIATIAGSGQACLTPTGTCGDGPATQAQLNQPGGVAVDTSGDVFIADTLDNKVREVTPGALITTVAGNGTAAAPVPGLATSSPLNGPSGVYVDSSGNLFIADTVNNEVEEVTGTTLSVFAGTGTACANPTGVPACGNGGLATAATLNQPSAVFVQGGNVYVVDTHDFAIREAPVAPGNISSVAGNGVQCNPTLATCDGGSAISSNLNLPAGIFVNASGFWIADQNDNVVRTWPNTGASLFAGEYFNAAYYGNGGEPTSAELLHPDGMVLDSTGNLLVADSQNNAIRKIPTSGNISTVVGTGQSCNSLTCGDGGLASLPAAMLASPSDVAFDNHGNMYIADTLDHAIRVVNNTASVLKFYLNAANETDIQPGDIQTVVGNISSACPGVPSECGDGGPANAPLTGSNPALLNSPGGLFLDKSGNIYIADTLDNVIRFVNTQPFGTPPIEIAGVSVAPGNIATVAGNYTACAIPTGTNPCGDAAAATAANLQAPDSVFVDTAGNIYIADTRDNRVRVVNPQASGSVNVAGVTIGAGDIATILGDGNANYTGDGHIGTTEEIAFPGGVFVSGNSIFVADQVNSRVRVVNLVSGNTQTAVGNGINGFTGDGGSPTAAELARPIRVLSDSSSNLYIADASAQRIRKLGNVNALPPTASLSSSVPFANTALGTTSAGQTFTVMNTSIAASLTVSSVTITGTNAGDFKQTNNCTTVAAGASCTITVTFVPTAAGARSATLSVADNATGSPQTETLSGTAVVPFSLPTTGALSPASVTAGSSATGTVTVTWSGSSTAAVALSCAVTPAQTNGPTCSLSPSPVTPKNGTATSTLTVSTSAATSSSGALQPSILHGQGSFAATWLFLPAMVLSGLGSKKRKALLCLLLALAIAGCIFLVACGGGSSSSNNNNGGGGSGGTPSGNYTINVTATAAGVTPQTQAFQLTVQ